MNEWVNAKLVLRVPTSRLRQEHGELVQLNVQIPPPLGKKRNEDVGDLYLQTGESKAVGRVECEEGDTSPPMILATRFPKS